MRVEQLFNLAEKEGVLVEWWDFQPPLEAVYLLIPSIPPIIGLAESLKTASTAYFKCVFAEELGHHFTSLLYTIPGQTFFHYRERLKISRSEHRALKWAAQQLIPKERLFAAVKKGISQPWELAEHFDVTDEMIQFRLNLPDAKKAG